MINFTKKRLPLSVKSVSEHGNTFFVCFAAHKRNHKISCKIISCFKVINVIFPETSFNLEEYEKLKTMLRTEPACFIELEQIWLTPSLTFEGGCFPYATSNGTTFSDTFRYSDLRRVQHQWKNQKNRCRFFLHPLRCS